MFPSKPTMAPLVWMGLFVACAPPPAPRPATGPVEAEPPANKYDIVLSRPYRPGTQARIEFAKSLDKHTLTKQGSKLLEDKVEQKQWRLVATRDVVAGPKPGPAQLKYEVEELTLREAGEDQSLLPPGSELFAEREEGALWQYTLDGARAPESVVEAMEQLVGAGNAKGTPSDDAAFGSKVPRAVGETWSVDPSAFASSGVSAKSMTGTVELLALREVEGHESLEVGVRLEASGLSMPDLHRGAKLIDSELSLRGVGVYPLDSELPRLSQLIDIDMDMTVEVSNPQGTVVVELESHESASKRVKP